MILGGAVGSAGEDINPEGVQQKKKKKKDMGLAAQCRRLAASRVGEQIPQLGHWGTDGS